MVSNLPKAGYKLIVHDADASKAQKVASQWTNTTASEVRPEVFTDCDIVVTLLPQGKVVREVLLGEGGNIIIDTSSSSPYDTKALGAELAQHSLELLDSPITQTYMHATHAGESTLMVGADSAAAFARARPVLERMGRYIFHMCGLGAGHAMKTLNNYVMASSLVALSDSLLTGQNYGPDPQQMVVVLNVSTGMCFQTLDPVRRDGITGRLYNGFKLELLVKGLGITEEFMEGNGFETRLPGVVKGYLKDALAMVDEGADHAAVLSAWEQRAWVRLKRTEKV